MSNNKRQRTDALAGRGKAALYSENLFRISKAPGVSSDHLLTDEAHRYLRDTLSARTPKQYRHLEDIIDGCLAVISKDKAQGFFSLRLACFSSIFPKRPTAYPRSAPWGAPDFANARTSPV